MSTPALGYHFNLMPHFGVDPHINHPRFSKFRIDMKLIAMVTIVVLYIYIYTYIINIL